MNAIDLSDEFARQAEWRRGKAAEYPDNIRNAKAAEIFDHLAETAPKIDSGVIDTFVSLYEGVEDGEIWQEWLREVGFYRWPATADEIIIRELVAEGTDFQCLRAAYEKAREVWPQDRITFRQGIRIIKERMPDRSEQT